MENKPIAVTKNLNVWYNKKHILDNINIHIFPKSVTAFIGASGCGKSTLLRCFNRMNDFIENYKSSGSLLIEGYDVCKDNVDVVLLRSKVGMVFQKPNPFPKSIYDNVAYGPKLQGIDNKKSRLDEIVEKSLKSAGLWDEVCDILKESAMNLSGGQQQRLCIARAIAVKPMILLMDEPCSALDPKSTLIVESLIDELKEKFTIIMVTHSMKQAKKTADTIVFLSKGRVVEYGDTYKIFTDPKMQETREYFWGDA